MKRCLVDGWVLTPLSGGEFLPAKAREREHLWQDYEWPAPCTEIRGSVPKASTDEWGSLAMLLTPAVASVQEEKCSQRPCSSSGGSYQKGGKGEHLAWGITLCPMLKTVVASPGALHRSPGEKPATADPHSGLSSPRGVALPRFICFNESAPSQFKMAIYVWCNIRYTENRLNFIYFSFFI